jgi:predicted MFS family arabinose efflux permease
LMVLATTFVLAYVPQRRLGLVSGIIFAGVAAGIAGSGTAVPFLLQLGVTSTWILFGIFSLLLTAVVWNGWPDNHQPVTPQLRFDFPKKSNSDVGLIFASLCVEYALAAMALVPHMVFIVDFVARGLGYGVTIGSLFWIVFGLSALCGSVLTGWLGDAMGFKLALRIVFALEIAAILVPSILQLPLPLLVSTILAGLFVTGSSTIVLGRIQEILRGADRAHTARAWRAATISFALGQGIAAYAFSWLFAATGSYPPLFALGTAALGLALIIDVITNSLRRSST